MDINTSTMARDPRTALNNFNRGSTNIGSQSPSSRNTSPTRNSTNFGFTNDNINERQEGEIGSVSSIDNNIASTIEQLKCGPTPFASLFSQFMPPKYPFMFFASIKLRSDMIKAFNLPFVNGEMHWFIKQISRPNVTYEYDDVNMYNFRAKVIKKSTFEPISMEIYDDAKDVTQGFWNTFIRIMSPITNLDFTNRNTLEANGMNWSVFDQYDDVGILRNDGTGGDTRPTPDVQEYSAGTGVIPSSSLFSPFVSDVIKEINVYHIIDFGKRYVLYNYYHPKITNITMDELNWETNGPQTIKVDFAYEHLNVTYPENLSENVIANNLPPVYPIRVNGTEINSTNNRPNFSDPDVKISRIPNVDSFVNATSSASQSIIG